MKILVLFMFITSLFAHRYYDAATGRFIQVDRFSEKYRTMSAYVGMGNNPLYYVDPTGDSLNTSGMTDSQIGQMRKNALENGYLMNIDDHGNVTFANNPFVNSGGFPTGVFSSFQQLANSDVMYRIENGTLPEGTAGKATTHDGKSVSLILDINQGADFSTLQHEVSHGVDFDNGQIWFRKKNNGKWVSQNNSLELEYKAYSSQFDRPKGWNNNYKNNMGIIIDLHKKDNLPEKSREEIIPFTIRFISRESDTFRVFPKGVKK